MTDDLISRQAAIEAVGINTWAGQRLLKVPTAEPDTARAISTIIENEKDMRVIERNAEPRWIPVTERLPDDETDILVTYVDGEETRIVPVNYGRGTWFDCIFDRELNPHMVTAWMPLPTPWKGESDATG